MSKLGTRHLILIKLDGELPIQQYGQWDGYLDGQGRTIITYLQNVYKKEPLIRGIKKLKPATKEFWEDVDRLVGKKPEQQGWDNFQYNIFKRNYPELCRDTGAEILTLLQMEEASYYQHFEGTFDPNDVWIEYTYLLDLDTETLEIYCRYDEGCPVYANCKFVARVPFKDATHDWLGALIKQRSECE